jgi:hypothetical protein
VTEAKRKEEGEKRCVLVAVRPLIDLNAKDHLPQYETGEDMTAVT